MVYDGDKVKAFIEWAREHAERLYPDVGMRSYVVPPIFVHKHSTRYNPAAGADVLQEAQKSSPKGEKAHSHVARSFSVSRVVSLVLFAVLYCYFGSVSLLLHAVYSVVMDQCPFFALSALQILFYITLHAALRADVRCKSALQTLFYITLYCSSG